MFTKFFGVTNRNKFLNELEKVLKDKFADKEDIDKIINSIGQADGIASLDDSGKVPSEQLPSYVDDIIEVEDYAHLPEVGETGKIYVTLDTGNQYRWGGSEYVPLNENSIQGIGIKKIIKLTQAEYDALSEKDSEAIYITNAPQALANGVYILYTDGSLSNYDTLDAGKTPVGPVLKTDNVCFVIHPNENSSKVWSSDTSTLISGVTTVTDVAAAKLDFSGKENTDAVIASGLAGSAFTFAVEDCIYTDGRTGHLPSCGELEEIRLNESNVNIAMRLCGGRIFNFAAKSDTEMWCSTQVDNASAWCWQHNNSGGIWRNIKYKTNTFIARSVSTYVSTNKTYKLYQGSNLIASSEDINRINNLEDKVTEKADKLVSPTAGHLVKTDALGGLLDAGLAMVKMTKAEYDALVTKDPLTMYLVDASPASFGGLQISSQPLYYGANGFELRDSDDWSSNSYNSVYGKNEGSYYFNFLELGSYFDSDGTSFNVNSGDIDNANTIDGWRIPTKNEILNWFTTDNSIRPGSTVNGRVNTHFASVRGSTMNVNGFLIFPDNLIISGENIGTLDSFVLNSFDYSKLEHYISLGCCYIPTNGQCYLVSGNLTWSAGGNTSYNQRQAVLVSSTEYNNLNQNLTNLRYNIFDWMTAPKGERWGNVRLVKPTASQLQIYLGSVLIADSNLPNEIEQLLASI